MQAIMRLTTYIELYSVCELAFLSKVTFLIKRPRRAQMVSNGHVCPLVLKYEISLNFMEAKVAKSARP
jgi:hypothetical protein